jgi:hypothetical protein
MDLKDTVQRDGSGLKVVSFESSLLKVEARRFQKIPLSYTAVEKVEKVICYGTLVCSFVFFHEF